MLESLLELIANFLHSRHPDPILAHTHNPWLVTLSVLIAILASYTALDLAGRVAAWGRARWAWLIGGAIAMGTGIWSMHFVAMLAFRLPIPVRYDVMLVIVSWLAATVASGLALFLVSHSRLSWRQLTVGGLLMGAAISGMHYIGTAAIRLAGIIHLEPIPVTLSIVLAIGASMAALWLQFRLRAAATRLEQIWKALAAVVMGFAIAIMHYTGMFGTVFHADASLPASPPGSIEITSLGASAIVVGTIMVLGFALLASLLDQRVGNLTYTRKFTLISGMFLVPLIAFYPLVEDQRVRIDNYGYKELYGAEYLRALQQVLQNIQLHEFLLDQRADGAVTDDEVIALQSQLDADFEALQAIHDRTASNLGLAVNAPANLRERWRGLKEAAFRLPAETRKDQHSQMTRSIRDLINQIGDKSYLILDPDLDTYYLMDTVLLKLPENQTLLARLLAVSENVAQQRQLTPEDRSELTALASLLRSNLTTMNSNIGTALLNNASDEMRPLLEDPLTEHTLAINQFIGLIENRMIAEPEVVEVSEVVDAARAALKASDKLYDGASAALTGGIQARITLLTNRLIFMGAFALVTALAAFIIGILMMRSISRPLNELTAATRRLAEGDLATRVAVTTSDEAGQAGQAFNQMAEQLQASQRELAARNRALATSADISRRLSTLLEQKQIVANVVEQIQAAFNYYHVHIYLLDDRGENLIMAAGTGEAGKAMLARGHRIVKGRGLVGRAAELNNSVLAPDTTQDPGWLPNPLLPNTKAEVAVPIAFGDEVVGVLDVQHNVRGDLTQEDANLLQTIANQIAIALRNARSLEQARRQAEREAMVNMIGQRIQSAGNVEDAMQIAVRELGRALKAQQTRVRLNVGGPGNGNGQAEGQERL